MGLEIRLKSLLPVACIAATLFVSIAPRSAQASLVQREKSSTIYIVGALAISSLIAVPVNLIHGYDLLNDKKPYVVTQVMAWVSGSFLVAAGILGIGESDPDWTEYRLLSVAAGIGTITLAVLAAKNAPVEKAPPVEGTAWQISPMFIPQRDASPLIGGLLTISNF